MAKNSNELEKYQKWAKKRQKGLSPFSYLNPDGGNVPLGIEFFNSAVSQSGPGDIGSAGESGDVGGMGEAIDFEKTEQDFKLYDSQQKMKDASNVSKAQSQVLRAKALMDSYQGGKEDLEANMGDQERITLYYDDIEVTGYYGPIDWETGYPEYDYEEIISYEYDVDKNDIVELLIDKVYEDNPDIEDDEVEAYVIDNFDDLLDKYYDYVLDYYRKYATSEANETYNYEEEHSDDYYEEDYESDDEIDYLQEAGTHIEDMAKYKMDALTNEIDDLNQSLDDIVDSAYPDYKKRDSLANRLNSAQEDLIRLQDEFGYIIDKPIREFLENGEMSLREALNQFDYVTDNQYDLRNIYDSLEESVELDKKLSMAIMRGYGAKKLYEVLQGKSFFEDTVKRGNKWANVGKDGKADSGKFRTKKEADAQRKAMFANGYKGEALTEDSDASVYDKLKNYLASQGVDLSKYE